MYARKSIFLHRLTDARGRRDPPKAAVLRSISDQSLIILSLPCSSGLCGAPLPQSERPPWLRVLRVRVSSSPPVQLPSSLLPGCRMTRVPCAVAAETREQRTHLSGRPDACALTPHGHHTKSCMSAHALIWASNPRWPHAPCHDAPNSARPARSQLLLQCAA